MNWLSYVINHSIHSTNVKSPHSWKIPVRKRLVMPILMARKLRFTEVTADRIGIQPQLFNDKFLLLLYV